MMGALVANEEATRAYCVSLRGTRNWLMASLCCLHPERALRATATDQRGQHFIDAIEIALLKLMDEEHAYGAAREIIE